MPMTEETKEKLKEAEKLILTGTPMPEACKRVGWSRTRVYQLRAQLQEEKQKKAAKKQSKPKKQSVLKITDFSDLPPVPSDGGKLFLIYGRPDQLASFARSYQ